MLQNYARQRFLKWGFQTREQKIYSKWFPFTDTVTKFIGAMVTWRLGFLIAAIKYQPEVTSLFHFSSPQ
jgi:hypothetical protein